VPSLVQCLRAVALAARSGAGPRRRGRRPFHHHEAGSLKMLHQPIGSDPGHHLIGVVDALPAIKPEREGQAVRDLIRCCGAEAGRLGHGGTIGDALEQSKNPEGAQARRRMLRCMPSHGLRIIYQEHQHVMIGYWRMGSAHSG
jgi:hypothetical protein